jgi:hypothetical protein
VSQVGKYKRRTFDEAKEIAMERLLAEAPDHLTFEQFRHCLTEACLYGGGPSEGWRDRLGYVPDPHLHYEIGMCEWAEFEGGPSPRHWVRILVSRDRGSDLCVTWWEPSADAEPGVGPDPAGM